MKYSFVIFNKDDTSRLVKKLKLEKVTMQSFLNVLLSMSCRQVYAQLGSESEKNKTIVNNYTVSLRPFAEDKSQFGETSLSENIGFLIGFLYYMDNESKNEDSIKTFWQMVRKENESIKLKIENKDQYKPICNFGEKEFNPFEYLVDTVITNLGIIDESFNSTTSLHKIKSGFISLRSQFALRVFFNNFLTVNGELNWTFGYNSFYLKKQQAEIFLQYFKENFNNLIQ